MQIEKRTMNWMPKASAWEEAESRREKRRAYAASDRANWDNLAVSFSRVRDAQATGGAELAARRAATRLNIKA